MKNIRVILNNNINPLFGDNLLGIELMCNEVRATTQ
jgi:hypothetical protein